MLARVCMIQCKRKENKAKVENGKIKSPGLSKKHENIIEEKFPLGEMAPKRLCEESQEICWYFLQKLKTINLISQEIKKKD